MENIYKKEILEKYENKKIDYQEFTFLVRNLLETFLKAKSFKFQITHRAKATDKLSEKIDRKFAEGKEYKKLEDVEDLAGVRIVFYLEDDENEFIRVFFNEFEKCILDREEKIEESGYRGWHVIFSLNKERADLIEYKKYEDLKCEIQISTILYHAWSEVEHDIIYKPGGKKDLLDSLGLVELKAGFQKLMADHIQQATFQLSYINRKYKSITAAGEILSSNFVVDIALAKTNDEIFQILSLLEDFFHKKPEEVLSVLSIVLTMQPKPPSVIHRFKDGELLGKTHKELILKSLEILKMLRYMKPDEVLQLSAIFSLSDDREIKQKALDVASHFAKYDYGMLTKTNIGYGAQRKVLDFILGWSRDDQFKFIEFIENVSEMLLSSSIEGSELIKDDTIQMHFGAVKSTDFLKKIRRETIDLIFSLYKATEDSKLKLRLINILDEATMTPPNVAYGDDLVKLISDDLDYLIDIYTEVIFPDGKTVTDDLAVVKQIEQKLYWINRGKKFKSGRTEELRQRILNNESYHIFRLLVGDLFDYDEEDGNAKTEEQKTEELKNLVDGITEKNAELWFKRLNDIADQHKTIDDWEFRQFKEFIEKLYAKNPALVNGYFEKAFDEGLSLKHFITTLMSAARENEDFNIWDKYVEKIVKAEDIQSTMFMLYSLMLPNKADLDKLIRDKDIDILEKIIAAKDEFLFVSGGDRQFHFAVMNSLLRIYNKNQKRIEELIVKEFSKNSENYQMYLQQFASVIRWDWIKISDFKEETIEVLKNKIIEHPDLDWHLQELLLDMAEKNGLSLLLTTFHERIKKDESRESVSRLILEKRYEAIPYHINPEIIKFISKNLDEYYKIIEEWLTKFDLKWSIYNWDVSHFLQRIGRGFHEILSSLIRKGGDDNLMKAAQLMQSLDNVNFDLCIEIIRGTKNESIINKVDANMRSTGVVSGQYGITEAYEAKARMLEKYKDDNDERVKNFAINAIKSFQVSAKSEWQRADEEKSMRKIEFEGTN